MGTSASMSSVRSSLWFIPVMCVFVGVLVSISRHDRNRPSRGFELIPRSLRVGPTRRWGFSRPSPFRWCHWPRSSSPSRWLSCSWQWASSHRGSFRPSCATSRVSSPSGCSWPRSRTPCWPCARCSSTVDGQVPGVAILVGFVLVLTSIAMLVLYVHHIGRSLRVSALIELVGNDTCWLLDQRYPESLHDDEPDAHTIIAPHSGVLVAIHRRRLVGIATAADCVMHVVPAVGGFVPAGAALIRIARPVERRPPWRARSPAVGPGAHARRGCGLRVQDVG